MVDSHHLVCHTCDLMPLTYYQAPVCASVRAASATAEALSQTLCNSWTRSWEGRTQQVAGLIAGETWQLLHPVHLLQPRVARSGVSQSQAALLAKFGVRRRVCNLVTNGLAQALRRSRPPDAPIDITTESKPTPGVHARSKNAERATTIKMLRTKQGG